MSAEELRDIRQTFPKGGYPLKIEHTTFSLKSYQNVVADNATDIAHFTQKREQAFAAELARWIASGQINFESDQGLAREPTVEDALPEHCVAVESPVAELPSRPPPRILAGHPEANTLVIVLSCLASETT